MPHDGAADNLGRSSLPQTIEKKFPADYRWVRRTIHELEKQFSDGGLSADQVGSISIVLAEALNNVVEHAMEEDGKGDIKIIVRVRNKSLLFEIRDSGHPMPAGRAPMGNHPMTEFNQFDALPEGGYGWFLIRELVQDLVYDRQNDENMLLFRYRLDD